MRDLSPPATTFSSTLTGPPELNKRLLIFLLMLILSAVVVVFHIMFGKNSLKEQRKVTHEIEKYQAQIDSLQQVLDSCNLEIERLKNDSLYKEELLRTRYGMSHKGEKVFQLTK